MDDDLDYTLDLPAEPFNKTVLVLPPLIVVGALAEGIATACKVIISAVNSHLRWGIEMRDFQTAAAMEIESLIEGES